MGTNGTSIYRRSGGNCRFEPALLGNVGAGPCLPSPLRARRELPGRATTMTVSADRKNAVTASYREDSAVLWEMADATKLRISQSRQ